MRSISKEKLRSIRNSRPTIKIDTFVGDGYKYSTVDNIGLYLGRAEYGRSGRIDGLYEDVKELSRRNKNKEK